MTSIWAALVCLKINRFLGHTITIKTMTAAAAATEIIGFQLKRITRPFGLFLSLGLKSSQA
jgi:hypothetical protein